MTISYGVNDTGFAIKSFQVLQSEIQTDFQSMFGNTVDISTNSPEGQIINNFALKLATVWELLLSIVSMMNPDSAEGAALDTLCGANGIIRRGNVAAQVPVCHYGTVSTSIPAGTLVRDSLLNTYALISTIVIGTSVVADAYITCPTPAEADFSVILNSITITYSASPGDSAYVIYTNLMNLINATPNIDNIIYAFIDISTSLLRIQAIDGGFTPFTLSVAAGLTITKYGTPGNYACTVAGFLQPLANDITTIVNPIVGLTTIDNLVGGEAGSNAETDEQLRVRRLLDITSQSGCSDGAMATALPGLVSGITYCSVTSNKTDSTDTFNRPPHSVEVSVLGGDPTLIAQAIWQIAPAGIATYGNESIVILDSNGDSQTIYFTRPQPVYIWVRMTITHSTKIELPVDAAAAIQTAIMNWSTTNSQVNEDVIVQNLFSPTYSVPGIATVNTLEIGSSVVEATPPAGYAYSNITINARQLPVYEAAHISVTVN